VRRLIGAVMIIIGAGAFTACLRSVFAGMRDVMIRDGGSCGSGGPYVIARPCSSGDIRLLMVGVLGGLVAAAVYAAGTSAVSRSAPSAGLVAWVAAFGALGWNFIGLVIQPPAGQGRSGSYLIAGIVFWALAVGGLVWLLGGLIDDLRPSSKPAVIGARVQQPIVQAVIPSGLGAAPPITYGGWSADGTTALGVTGAVADALPQPGRRWASASLGIWLATSVVGAAIGLVLSSDLVSLLR
jgi:hypothetical protein